MPSYDISQDPRGFIAVNTLVIRADDIRAMWRDIAAICEATETLRVIGRRSDDQQRSVPDLMQHREIFREFGIDHRYRIAWVDENPQGRALLAVTCDVLRSSHLVYDIAAFADESSAIAWILSDEPAPATGFEALSPPRDLR